MARKKLAVPSLKNDHLQGHRARKNNQAAAKAMDNPNGLHTLNEVQGAALMAYWDSEEFELEQENLARTQSILEMIDGAGSDPSQCLVLEMKASTPCRQTAGRDETGMDPGERDYLDSQPGRECCLGHLGIQFRNHPDLMGVWRSNFGSDIVQLPFRRMGLKAKF